MGIQVKEISEEEKKIAKTSPIIDPFNMKINNLGPKSRDNWLKKIQQSFDENLSSTGSSTRGDEDVDKVCPRMEHEIFAAAKNLIIYQANCMKKINEIKKFTKDKKSFLDELTRMRREAEVAETLKSETNTIEAEIPAQNVKKEFDFKSTSFTSALTVFKTEELVI